MRTPLNGFDKIAWLYDPLARLVFGNRLQDAQETHLHRLKPEGRILILGGGTGAILESLFRLHPNCQVTFIDASRRMIKRAQQRKLPGRIQYIHGDEGSIPRSDYDAVITPFYLDMFTETGLSTTIMQIGTHLTEGAVWIAVDFVQSERLVHRILLFIMYAFFRTTAGIKAKSLPNWRRVIQQNGWHESEFQTDGFIGSSVFSRRLS